MRYVKFLENVLSGAYTRLDEPTSGTIGQMKYRSYRQLLAEPEDMSASEKERLARIKTIPETVREIVQEEIDRLRQIVMETEAKMDALNDYLNGEDLSE